jgi:hypothetical protein
MVCCTLCTFPTNYHTISIYQTIKKGIVVSTRLLYMKSHSGSKRITPKSYGTKRHTSQKPFQVMQ